MGFIDFIQSNFYDFITYTGFANAEVGNIIMIAAGIFFIWLAIKKDFEPLLLVPIGLGIILGNIPFKAEAGLEIGLYEDNSVLNIFYQGVRQGWYPPLVFLGIGAMTDFSALISNPKLILIGAAAQFGIFGAYMLALAFGFEPNQAAGIAIIGNDGIHAAGSRCIGYYRRCGRSYGYLPVIQTESEPHGSHCSMCLLIHGTGTGYPASFDASAHNKEGACNPHEAGSPRKPDRAYNVPYYRSVAYYIHRSVRSAAARYAVLR